jgi:Flp pilus assembly protein TadG
MAKKPKRRTERGFTLILHAIMLTGTIAAVGLAVDVGSIYMIKARLSAAVDGAALAAGRSVNLTSTLGQAQTQAIATANQFFSANFPTGYLNSKGTPTVTPTFSQEKDANGNPSGVLDVKVSATVNAPTYFMNIFNINSIPVASSGTASRRGLVLMLVLDQSSSMNTTPDPISGLTACDAMKQSAQNFITLLSPYDMVGMVTFDITAHLAYTPSANYDDGSLNTAIGSITCGSNTNTISALEMAYQQIKAVNLPLALNTIILFTDGSPNGVSAAFPTRGSVDNRWGPALNPPVPPAQSGSTYGHTNNCTDVGPADSTGVNEEAICLNMNVVCPAGGTVTGTLAQWGNQDSWGGSTYGLAQPTDSDPTPTLPAGCSQQDNFPGTNIRQFIAYIPDTDLYGNSLHGVAATSGGPTVSGGMLTRDTWLYQATSLCAPDPTVLPNCKNVGDFWASHAGTGSMSNFFPAGSAYAGKFRPDQPNTVVAAAMNGTMAEANKIRADAGYHTVIHTIYLTGNGTDSVDREFLAVVANAAQVTALPYDPVTFAPYTNPAYQTSQETGKYLVTADRNTLQSLFAQLASEVLRLSQ